MVALNEVWFSFLMYTFLFVAFYVVETFKRNFGMRLHFGGLYYVWRDMEL